MDSLPHHDGGVKAHDRSRRTRSRPDTPALRWSASDGVAWEGVRLLDADPDLALGLSDADRAAAHAVLMPALRAEPGTWVPPERLGAALAVVVLDGLLLARGLAFARDDVHLFGPGDTLDGRLLADRRVTWRALEGVRLAVLDERFLLAARRWPALMTGLTRRLLDCQQEQRTRTAICAMPRVEERVLAFLSHVALRWGHVTPDGVTLHAPLTHELLGALIGARRPTVSLALTALMHDGFVGRRADGTWLLPLDCRDWPAAGVPRAGRSIAA
jgi:CRP/FNR family transcriptional regulator, cyclic AMP receptor protein